MPAFLTGTDHAWCADLRPRGPVNASVGSAESVCPSSSARVVPIAASHTRAAWSPLAVTTYLPFGLNLSGRRILNFRPSQCAIFQNRSCSSSVNWVAALLYWCIDNTSTILRGVCWSPEFWRLRSLDEKGGPGCDQDSS
jgi:hypothetical protein